MTEQPHSFAGADEASPREAQAQLSPGVYTPFREIVACLDGSEFSEGALRHARAVATALGAHLTLLRVLESEDGERTPADAFEWHVRRREAQAYLEELAAKSPTDAEPAADVVQGGAAEQICLWTDQHRVGLTVLCSHGAGGPTPWSLASTAGKLIDRLPGSLLIVPAAARGPLGDELRYRRVLLPLDGSARAESALPVAVRLAVAHDAELLLVHVVPVPELTQVGPLDADDLELERRVVERNERVASRYLDRIRARASQADARVRAVLVRGGAVRTRLPRLIEREGANLVVMSAHGHTGRTDSPYGTGAAYLLTHSATPLLVLRELGSRGMQRVERPATRSGVRLPEQAGL